MEFFATCPAGFERLLANELQTMRVPHVRPLKGQVSFEGTVVDAYRVCLWSRLASRVIAVVARGGARDADELYETIGNVAWEDHLPAGATFAIGARGTNQQLRNTQFVALRTKDAVSDRLLARTGARPVTDTTSPDLHIEARISRDRVTVGIDLSGEPLFRRGYETARGAKSPLPSLRPDYAAALLSMAGWSRVCKEDLPTVVIPFSGSGTLAVEAAAWARGQAPGLLRGRWGFEGWAQHDADAWNDLTGEARNAANGTCGVRLVLSDTRAGYEAAARQALRAAGIDLEPLRLADCPSLAEESIPVALCADLSWVDAESLADKAATIAHLSGGVARLPSQTMAAVLTKDHLTDLVLGKPGFALDVIAGKDDASIRSYGSLDQAATKQVELAGKGTIDVLVPASDQFARRIAKVYRQRRKWAAREDVSCYRIYDADLPDYAVSIDLFEGSQTPGRWLQIYEYAPPKEVDQDLATARLLDVLAIAPAVLDVKPQDTFVRVRTKARGGSQYADEARHPAKQRPGRGASGRPALPPGAHLVDEGGLTFEVNFSSRLDCGIFLDHRDTRAMLREMAKQTKGSKRFLNLFAYTGSGTCYAADGGARHTTTVDLSRPSLDWAQRNMERNGFVGKEHEYVQADVLAWVSEQRHTKNRWDLIFCDVPTFSNSQRMRTSSFDVQRDHAELLIGVSRLLTRDGTCVFSCNLRTFRIDEAALLKAGVAVEDITAQTIPEDFSRNPRIHKCFLVRRTPRA
ncbi:MAG: bifunctional 23S rRNA (guanine(2069)-N(7))-methyltransferase RlmK/23S rRNA (guanine(2445)-N(2))-methyltransferase RlmL [Atopobiaceae bacterium]|nr:bifunctional 23S rRNA (guanine(2069)-N(7))-methyltransferase RlmK/23S rRNA (guanine(2445)-N(2))-methyltransferase RlmL [Atopobiaceae bacterium]